MKKLAILTVVMLLSVASSYAKKKPVPVLVKWTWGYDTISHKVIDSLFLFSENDLIVTKNNQPWKVEKGKDLQTNFKDIRIKVDVQRVGKFAGRDTTYRPMIVTGERINNFTDEVIQYTDTVGYQIDHIRVWVEFQLKDSNEKILIPFYLNSDYYFSAEGFYLEYKSKEMVEDPNHIPPKTDFYTVEGAGAIMVDGNTIPGYRETIDIAPKKK